MTAQFISCQWNAASYGAGDFVVASAVAGYNVPADLNPVDGGTYRYYATDGTLVENGTGVWSAGSNTLTRVPIDSAAPLAFVTPPVVSMFPSPALTLEPPPATVVRYDVAQSLTSAQQAQARANINVQKKNYIINGAMMASQENGAVVGTATADGYYPVDQWVFLRSTTGTLSVAQVASTTPAGSPNRISATVTSADTSIGAGEYVLLGQPIEGYRVTDLLSGTTSAKTVTLRFGVKAPAGTYCVTFRNSAANRSYVAEYVISAGEANTDVVKSVTVALDQTGAWLNTNALGIKVTFGLACGSTFQTSAGAWAAGNFFGSSNQFNFMGTNGNVFELFDVGLYEGAAAPAFVVPDYAAELQECLRYFYPWAGGAIAFANGTTFVELAMALPVPMRSAPTVSNGTAFATLDTAAASNVNPSSISVTSTTATTTSVGFRINNYSGLTSGQAVAVLPGGNMAKIIARL